MSYLCIVKQIKVEAHHKQQTKIMAKIIIESKFKSTATIYQIEIICSKCGKVITCSAYINEEEAQKHINWLLKYNYIEDIYKQYGKIYEAYIKEIVLFA